MTDEKRVIGKLWGEDGTAEGVLLPRQMDEPLTIRVDDGSLRYIEKILWPIEPGDVPKRINVAVNPETIEILNRTIRRDGVSLTEAVRRLIGVGDDVTTAAKVEGCEVLLRNGDTTREVMVL